MLSTDKPIIEINRPSLIDAVKNVIKCTLKDFGQTATQQEFDHMVLRVTNHIYEKWQFHKWGAVQAAFHSGVEGLFDDKPRKITAAVLLRWLNEQKKVIQKRNEAEKIRYDNEFKKENSSNILKNHIYGQCINYRLSTENKEHKNMGLVEFEKKVSAGEIRLPYSGVDYDKEISKFKR